MASKITLNEKKWQAESDARTLVEYQSIMGSKPRMKAAQKAAAVMAKDLTAQVNQINKVVKTSKAKSK